LRRIRADVRAWRSKKPTVDPGPTFLRRIRADVRAWRSKNERWRRVGTRVTEVSLTLPET